MERLSNLIVDSPHDSTNKEETNLSYSERSLLKRYMPTDESCYECDSCNSCGSGDCNSCCETPDD